jgi:hypothetical protein
MKTSTILLISLAFLTGCVSEQKNNGHPATPISIPSLGLNLDAASGRTEILITVKSEAPRPLKTVRVFLALYNANRTRINAIDEPVEVLGPINPGQSLGPLEKVLSAGQGAFCVEVVRVEAVALDYSTRISSGHEAANLVAGGNGSVCTFKTAG